MSDLEDFSPLRVRNDIVHLLFSHHPEFIRETEGQYLMDREQEDQLQKELKALESLTKLRGQIEQEHGICQVDLLSEARAEQEKEFEQLWEAV